MADVDLSFFLEPPDLETTAVQVEALSPLSMSTAHSGNRISKPFRGVIKKQPEERASGRYLGGAIKESSQDLQFLNYDYFSIPHNGSD